MKKIYLKSLLAILVTLLSVSCTSEWDEQVANVALREGEVSLQWLSPNMGIKHVKSRATDPKTAEEQKINNVHVFVFGSDGNYLAADGADAFQGYGFMNNSQNMVLNTNLFGDQVAAGSATIVALANMPQNTFTDSNSDGRPDEITGIDSFKDFVFNLPTFTATLPESGLPMYGITDTPVDLSSDSGTKVILIQMKSLMARIDLDFTMDPYQSSDDGRSPALRVDKVSVGNFPMGGTIQPQLDTETITDDTNISLQTTEVNVPDFTGHTLREGEPQELTLYMFEHARAAKDFDYPKTSTGEVIPNEYKQRYKNSRAADDAAYIELEGVYTNHNDYSYTVTYRIYPGADAVDDFTIKANCQYKHNITVKGITVNNANADAEALLDTRVNIDKDDNSYFIEMLREREFDAHFNVTPMDVYIYELGGKVKIEILDAENNKWWIRMEPMKYSPTANGKTHADKAGEGKRNYFTTDLVTNTLSQSYSYEVTEQEERIYFYVDENVPQQGHRDGEDVDSREVTLRITYISPSGASEPREVTLRQAGMRAVCFDKYSIGGGDYASVRRDAYYFYIEEYEEYLSHYDGKNEYSDTYEGFKWGLNGLRSDLGASRNFYDYMSWGWANTIQIMNKYRSSSQWRGNEMTLNDTPSGAAEYCYNKNKRDEEGKVVEARWFLPTISELEYALEKYYGVFDVFQDKWYWSSNPGAAGNNGDTGENVDYARGTRIKYDPDNESGEAVNGYVHYRSNPDYPYDYDNQWYAKGQGGHAPRDTEFRIRAAYIYKEPDDARIDVTGKEQSGGGWWN